MNRYPLMVATGLLLAAGTPSPPREAPAAARANPPAVKLAAAAAAPVPFAAGEKLRYQILWGPALAATATIEAVARRPFYRREAWHFQVRASTVNAARLLFQLDDQFDSYTDARTLAGFRYERYIHEQGKKETHVTRLVGEGEPPPADGPAVRVPQGTVDPVGLLFALRARDWARTAKWTAPVFDGRKLYELRAERVEGPVIVTAGGARYVVYRILLRPYHRGKEVAGTRFFVSLANDPARTPVLIEAQVPLGSFRVELHSAPR